MIGEQGDTLLQTFVFIDNTKRDEKKTLFCYEKKENKKWIKLEKLFQRQSEQHCQKLFFMIQSIFAYVRLHNAYYSMNKDTMIKFGRFVANQHSSIVFFNKIDVLNLFVQYHTSIYN